MSGERVKQLTDEEFQAQFHRRHQETVEPLSGPIGKRLWAFLTSLAVEQVKTGTPVADVLDAIGHGLSRCRRGLGPLMAVALATERRFGVELNNQTFLVEMETFLKEIEGDTGQRLPSTMALEAQVSKAMPGVIKGDCGGGHLN